MVMLQSPAVTGNHEVNVSVLVRNRDAYPEVNDTMTTVLCFYTCTAHMIQYVLQLTLRVQIAVPEVAEDCVNVWIPIVAAIGGFVILVAIAVLLGFVSCFGPI